MNATDAYAAFDNLPKVIIRSKDLFEVESFKIIQGLQFVCRTYSGGYVYNMTASEFAAFEKLNKVRYI